MTNTLFEIAEDIAHIMEDDLSDSVRAELIDSIAPTLNEKAERYAAYLKSLEATINAHKKTEEELALKRKSLEKKREWLKSRAADALSRADVKKAGGPVHSLSIRETVSVVTGDVNAIPDEYCIIKTTKAADKRAIKELLQIESVNWASLRYRNSLVVK